MPKGTAVDKAIEKLEAEMAVLQLAILKLKEARDQKAQRKLRAVKPKPVQAAGQ